MRELLGRAGITLSREQLDQLWRFDQLLRQRNQDRDLTRLIEFETVIVKHYVDSMFVGQLIELPSPRDFPPQATTSSTQKTHPRLFIWPSPTLA